MPVVLDVVPAPGVDAFVLDGEVATLGALPASVEFARGTSTTRRDVGRRTALLRRRVLRDQERGAVSRKYRKQVARETVPALG